MPGFNLVRNARAFFTTNLSPVKRVLETGHTSASTFELQVLNGFSYSQNTESQTITVSEAGYDPARGQRTFNTALAPVEFSFSTYLRPSGSTTVTAEEAVLWNALFSPHNMDTAGTTVGTVTNFVRVAGTDTVTLDCGSIDLEAAGFAVGQVIGISGITSTDSLDWNGPAVLFAVDDIGATTEITLKYLLAPAGVATAPTTAPTSIKLHKGGVTQNAAAGGFAANLLAHCGGSNKNQLQAFGLVVIVDGITYLIDNAAMGQASVDFGLDGIATVAWTGSGVALREITHATAVAGAFGGGLTGNYFVKNVNANFITNKLATIKLASNLRGLGVSSKEYNVALTGGNLTINNNITYVTPEILGVVNQPIGYFTGTRAVSGNVTAYLKTGTNNTAQLLKDMLASSDVTTEPKFAMDLAIGGHNNATRIHVTMPGVMLQIPTIETQDVLSTTINFTAQGFDGGTSDAAGGTAEFDLEKTNEVTVRYFSAA